MKEETAGSGVSDRNRQSTAHAPHTAVPGLTVERSSNQLIRRKDMSIHSVTHHSRTRSRHAVTAIAAFALAALALPGMSNADTASVNGVRAQVAHGTLQVTSNDHSNAVALRLAS